MNNLAILERKNTVTSLELVEQINFFREQEGNKTELGHNDLLKIIRDEFEEEINLSEFWLFLLKQISNSESSKESWFLCKLYSFLSKKYDCFNFEIYFIFHNLWCLIKREETDIHSGKKSEKQIFSNAEEIVKKAIPTFSNGHFNKKVKNKYIDLLGICSETGKFIIVEFKKANKCAVNQLYSYDRMLGGENILVSLTEEEVEIKHPEIIYLTKIKQN